MRTREGGKRSPGGTGDRVNGTLHGLRDGASHISFVVRRGSTTIYEAPPLNFRVQPAP